MTCGRGPQDLAVHCPHCQAEPNKPCLSPSGKPRINHGERVHLAYALAFPESGFKQGEAERYRKQWPGVDVCVIVCAPSRAQVLWWNRWGANLTYDEKAYEAEHGHADTSTTDTDIKALPPGQDDFVGQPVSEIQAQFDKLPKAKVRRKPR